MKLVILIFIWLAAVFTVSGQSQYFRVVNGIPCMPVLSNSSDVTNPETGSFFYSTDDNSFYFYTGSSWVGLCSFSSPVLSTGREWFRVVNGIPAFPLLNPSEVAEVAVPGTAFYSSTGVIQVNDGAGWKSIFDYGNTENVSENANTAMGTVNGGSGLFTIPVLASEPSSPGTGAFYFDATISALRVYNGTAWLGIDCGNCAPQVVGVTFTEDATNFIAGYTYYDKEGDAENSVTVQWYVADDDQGANSTLLSEVNDLPQADFYSLHNQKYLRAVVVAQAQDGNLYSDEAFSEWVAYADCAPQVTSVTTAENLTDFIVGYAYYDKEGDAETSADVQWYVADNDQGSNSTLLSSESSLARSDFYSLYNDKYLKAVVVAYAESGNPYSEEVSSEWVAYADCVPQVTSVAIVEDLTEFNARYLYYDKEDDVESSADVQWYVADDAQGTNSTLLSEETALSRPDFYSLYDEKYLQAVVVARAETGNPNNSDAGSSGWVLYTNCVPQVTGVTIAEDVTSFNAAYAYYDKEGDNESGSADVQWYVADDAQGTNSTLLSENSVLSRPDFYSLYDGKYLQAVVVSRAETGNVNNSDADSSQWVACNDCVPQVTSVAIVEDLTEFNARYMYYDKEDDAESSADVQWYVADDAQGTNSTLLSEETALSRPDFYSLYDGKYLQAVVVSRAGTGNPNNSDADSSGWVLYTNCVPQVTGVTIAEDETSFNAAYAYYDKEGDNESGSADVQWYVADDAQGTNSTLLSENPVLSRPDFYSLYDGKYLQAVVVARAGTGNPNNSDAGSSGWVLYTNCVPQVTGVTIAEDVTSFNAAYAYYDKEGDNESGSADVQWYVADDAQGTNSTLLSENPVLSRPDFYSLYDGKYLQAVVVSRAGTGNLNNSDADSSQWVAYTDCVPQVTSVAIVEDLTEFNARYMYYDKEDDAESSADVQWYVADDAQGTNSTLLSEETALSRPDFYSLYDGKYLQAVVVSRAGTGNPNNSDAGSSGWVLYTNCVPQVTGVTIAEDETSFNAAYAYYDKEGDNESGSADVQWYVADDAQGTNSTLLSENPVLSRPDFYSLYDGKYLQAVVVSRAGTGNLNNSDADSSQWVACNDCVPQVTSVAIVEDLTEFNVSYIYYDKEEDAESSADVQWYVADDDQGSNSILLSEETALSQSDFYSLYDSLYDRKYLQAVVVARAETGNPNNSDAGSSGWKPQLNCPESVTVTHVAGEVSPETVTITYPVVKTTLGADDGAPNCWIAQNLGATTQATSATDASDAAAGWYWQFNRKQGYAYNTGTSTRTPNTTWINPNTATSDWETVNDPCTILLGSNWRLPTRTETRNADSDRYGGGWNGYNDVYASVLKIHAAGVLNYSGIISNRSSYYYVATSSHNGSSAIVLYGSDTSGSGDLSTGAYSGFSVRCISSF